MLFYKKVLFNSIALMFITVLTSHAAGNKFQINKFYPATSKTDSLPAYTITFASTPPSIDGRIEEWSNITPILLNDAKAAIHYKNWQGPEDFGAKLYMMWDYDSLYFAAEIKDSAHLNLFEGKENRHGDSLQIAFDGFNDKSKDDYNNGDYANDDIEITLALTAKGPQIYCYIAQKKPKSYRPMSDTNISIVRSETDKITRYETAIKWVDIEPIMPTLKGALGFSAIVMNSNIAGTDIDGVLQWTEGMRNYKSTLDFGNLYFEN